MQITPALWAMAAKRLAARLIGNQGSFTTGGVGIEMPDVRLVHVAGAAVIFAVDPVFDPSERYQAGSAPEASGTAQISGHVLAIG